MPDENQLTPAERELELHLAGLQPAQHRVRPEIVFFRAGQRAALRRLRCWQAASSTILLAILGLWWWQPPPRQIPAPLQLVSQDQRPRPPQPAAGTARRLPPELPIQAPGTREYLRLRTEVLIKGLEALPSPPLAPTPSKGVEAVSDWRSFAAENPRRVSVKTGNHT